MDTIAAFYEPVIKMCPLLRHHYSLYESHTNISNIELTTSIHSAITQITVVEEVPQFSLCLVILCPLRISGCQESFIHIVICCFLFWMQTLCITPTPPVIDWSHLPAALDPAAGELNIARAERKRRQIENIVWVVRRVFEAYTLAQGSGNQTIQFSIVEFGAGGGHLGLVLAFLFSTSARLASYDMVCLTHDSTFLFLYTLVQYIM